MIAQQTATPELEKEYIAKRERYENERIDQMLKNISTKKRVIVAEDELVQKIYPIYGKNEFPENPLDFRTNFYFPEKYFLGSYIDTKIFNTIVVWVMTIVLFIAVYFDWLRKIVKSMRF